MKTGKWNELSEILNNEEAIQALYPDPTAHRVSRASYPPKTRYSGVFAVPALVFVVEGSCRYSMDTGSVEVQEGEYVELPRGDYQFDGDDVRNTSIVRVYSIPR